MSKIVYQDFSRVVDFDSGEVKQETSNRVIQHPAEPPYVKMYINDLCLLQEIPESLKDVLFYTLRKLDYDGYIHLSARYRKQICGYLNISEKTLRNRISGLSKKKIITNISRSEYQVNPYLFAKGSWKSIVEQRKDFQVLITYKSNGERTVQTTEIEGDQHELPLDD